MQDSVQILCTSLHFYFAINNNLNSIDKKEERFKKILEYLLEKDKKEFVIKDILETDREHEDSTLIGMMMNKDLVEVGDLNISTREMFRNELLNEYFEQKYAKKEDGYTPKYNNYSLDEYNNLGGELKYAIEYLCEKGYLIKKNKDGIVCFLITVQGEDFCTEKYFKDQQITFHI